MKYMHVTVERTALGYFKPGTTITLKFILFYSYYAQFYISRHDSCTAECFTVLDSAILKFQIKIKEAMHIKWENPAAF